ncbi:MAG: PEP-CTERM sorting domain-containing protein [Planctomycetota bacterium]
MSPRTQRPISTARALAASLAIAAAFTSATSASTVTVVQLEQGSLTGSNGAAELVFSGAAPVGAGTSGESLVGFDVIVRGLGQTPGGYDSTSSGSGTLGINTVGATSFFGGASAGLHQQTLTTGGQSPTLEPADPLPTPIDTHFNFPSADIAVSLTAPAEDDGSPASSTEPVDAVPSTDTATSFGTQLTGVFALGTSATSTIASNNDEWDLAHVVLRSGDRVNLQFDIGFTLGEPVERFDATLLVFDTLPGDANLDGNVDTGDLAILAGNFGSVGTAQWTTASFNGDADVDTADLAILAGNFGQSLGAAVASAAVAIPEPASLALFTLGAAGLAWRRR